MEPYRGYSSSSAVGLAEGSEGKRGEEIHLDAVLLLLI